jgi:integrase
MKAYVQRQHGTWRVVIEEGTDPITGKRRRSSRTGGRTKKEANAALSAVVADLERGTYVSAHRLFTGGWLEDEFLPLVKTKVGPNTLNLYQVIVRAYVIPRIGRIELQRLRPTHLDGLYAELLAGGGRGGKPLRPKTVRNVHTVMHRALAEAVRGLISRNPADLASPGASSSREMRTWTGDQVGAFLGQVREDRLYAAWLTLATTGLRRGELLGLRWLDVDLDAGRLSIRRSLALVGGHPQILEPKTRRSRRNIPIPGETSAALKAPRTAQKRERLALGPEYQDTGLVFCREDGTALHPDRFSEWFEWHAKAAGLPRIRVHDARHTWATLDLQAGVPAKVVSKTGSGSR